MRKARWGVLGAAKIAVEKVIPAMQRGRYSQVDAIASRTLRKARRAADDLGIPKAYGSYEELLEDPDVDAIYNPLPNHLHVPWTLAAVRTDSRSRARIRVRWSCVNEERGSVERGSGAEASAPDPRSGASREAREVGERQAESQEVNRNVALRGVARS